jgi:hypothetical protein
VAATLGLADLLADGSRTADELAAATESDPDALYRLLRALASVEILHEEDGRLFSLAELGEDLRSTSPSSIAGWATFVGQPSHWQAWGDLLHSVRTGENAFRHVHGMDVWAYRSEHTEESAAFDHAMADLSRRMNAAVVETYDFARFRTIVDVGGGRGALLSGLLEAYRDMQGILFDQPHVVAGAGEVERMRVIPGSFFESVPEEGDAYVLKWIIHDWENEEAIAILRTCRRAMRPDAVLLLIERLLGEANAEPGAKFSDLNMLVSAGGRERTTDDYAELFAAARLRLNGVSGGNPVAVIEAVPTT